MSERVTFNGGRFVKTDYGWYDYVNETQIHRSRNPDFAKRLKMDRPEPPPTPTTDEKKVRRQNAASNSANAAR